MKKIDLLSSVSNFLTRTHGHFINGQYAYLS